MDNDEKACADCRHSRRTPKASILLCAHPETFFLDPVYGKGEPLCSWLRTHYKGKTPDGFRINRRCSGDLWESAI